MERYNPIIRKAVFNYPVPEPAVMDENAQQGASKDGCADVAGFHEGLWRRMETLSLKDLPGPISPIEADSSDSEASSKKVTYGYNFRYLRSDDDADGTEECIAPPNTPVYEDLRFLPAAIPEAVVGRQPGAKTADGFAAIVPEDSQDFRGPAESRDGFEPLDLEDSQDFRGAAEGRVSSDVGYEPMQMGDSQDFREPVEDEESVEVRKDREHHILFSMFMYMCC